MVRPPSLSVDRVLLLGTALTLLCLTGCEEDVGIAVVPPPAVQVDLLSQKPAALVDILWVVDNSGTMVEEQAALARNFDQFITGLTTCQGTGQANDVCDFESRRCAVSGLPCNPPDYHIGVISTDVLSSDDQGKLRQVGLCTTAAGASPAQDKFRHCRSSNAECAHDESLPNSDPANNVCDLSQSLSFVTATTPGASDAFSTAVQVGTQGSGRETGIEAAARALGRHVSDRSSGAFDPIPADNEGFLRPDASLFVIFVSDEDDSSFGQSSYHYRAFESLKGPGNEGLVSVSAIVGPPDADGPEGTDPGGCIPDPDEPDIRNQAGTRYVALAMYSRGLTAEFRVCDGQRLTCPETQSCQAPVDGLPGVCVPAGSCSDDLQCGNFVCSGGRGCISCSADRCQASPEGFLELLERNGVFGSICEQQFDRVLGALGFEAAGLARQFPLSLAPNCVESVPCCSDSVPEAECGVVAPLCVKLDGSVIANDRGSGWIYDVGANAIFFDGAFVPPPQSELQVSYTVAINGSNETCIGP